MLEAGFWSLVAAASLLVGAVIAQNATVSKSNVGRIMGFGAGALVAALAYELIPTSHVADFVTWISFGLGALVFYLADGWLESRSSGQADAGLAIALGALLDGIPESIVLGMSVAVGGTVSIGFLAAVFISNIPESLSSTESLRATWPARRIYGLWGAITIASGIAGSVGYFTVTSLPGSDGRYVQALAGGAVLTMLASSMIPESFREGGRAVALLTAFGFAVAAVLTLLD